MTDQDRPDPDRTDEPGFDDPADAWVRDLLASSRVTGPVPDDVAARLDTTLASLRAEQVAGSADAEFVTGSETGTGSGAGSDGGSDAPVVPLRRKLAPLLAAAAAVLLVAGGAVGVSRLGSDHAGSSQSAAGAADSTSADRAEGGSPAPQAPLDQKSDGLAAVTTALPRLTRATFAQDAATVMRRLSADVVDGTLDSGTSGSTPGIGPASPPASGDATTPAPATAGAEQPRTDAAKGVAPPVTSTPAPQALAAPVAACPGPSAPGAVTVPATLDGTPVALVFRPPTATAQVVEAWSCDGARLLASASVTH